jgi:GNAT superfamily N-acetyltransferase
MKRFWILNDLFVSPEFRGQGFSRELIEEAKNLCRKTDACAMLLETSVTNDIGNSLYPSAGFQLRDDANFMNGKLNKRIMLKVISVREEKDYLKQAIAFTRKAGVKFLRLFTKIVSHMLFMLRILCRNGIYC